MIQTWDSSVDLNDNGGAIATGDIFRIKTSLHKVAKSLTIKVAEGSEGDSIEIRLNPIVKLYLRRDDLPSGPFLSSFGDVVASEREIVDTSSGTIVIAAGETYTFNDEVQIDTLQLVDKSADFTLTVS